MNSFEPNRPQGRPARIKRVSTIVEKGINDPLIERDVWRPVRVSIVDMQVGDHTIVGTEYPKVIYDRFYGTLNKLSPKTFDRELTPNSVIITRKR